MWRVRVFFDVILELENVRILAKNDVRHLMYNICTYDIICM